MPNDPYGIDIGFDARFSVQGSKDAIANAQNTDFEYVGGAVAIAQELQRLFDLTPRGSFLDDPSYGVSFPIGEINDPKITKVIVKVEVLRALQHPSFRDRFRVRSIEVQYRPDTPNALWVSGVLECFGLSQPLWNFGEYAFNLS